MTDLKYWLWLTLGLRQNCRKITALLEHFDSPLDIYRAREQDFFGIDRLTAKNVQTLLNKSLRPVELVMEQCRNKGIRILTFDNPHYPRRLANIFDPPYVLYVRSRERMDLNEELAIAMVGTRKMTPYGRKTAFTIGAELAEAGVTVVSGMARGIDGAALSGALSVGGKPIAVLGCGVDVVYPPEHKDLMMRIAQSGMILSEYPPGSPPLGGHFPVRNRIISGLCAGTVVVESPEDGGSLITASLALEQGRDVFAVPGDITRPHSDGTNDLIRQGAHLVSSALDIISEYQDEYINIFEKAVNTEQSKPKIKAHTPPAAIDVTTTPALTRPVISNEVYQALPAEEQRIMDCLSITPTHVDTLAEKTALSAQELNAALTLLEMKGLITQLAGRHFVLNL